MLGGWRGTLGLLGLGLLSLCFATCPTRASAGVVAPSSPGSVAPSSPGSPGEFHIACPTSSLCITVDGGGEISTSTAPASPAARAWTTSDVDGTNRLTSISCPSGSFCAVTDDAGNILTSTDPAGGAGAWDVTHVGPVADVSCPTTGFCVAVGGRNVYLTAAPLTAGVQWAALDGIDTTTGPECGKYPWFGDCSAALTSISCSSAALCVTLDSQGELMSSTDPLGGVSAWTGPYRVAGTQLTSVACTPGGSCVVACATGSGLLGSDCPGGLYGPQRIDDDAGDVASFSPPATRETGTFTQIMGDPVDELSCGQALCFASDAVGHLLSTTLPDSTGATHWTPTLSDLLPGVGYNPISDVACPSLSACFAVDSGGTVLTTEPVSGSAASAAKVARVRFRKAAHLPVPHLRAAQKLRVSSAARAHAAVDLRHAVGRLPRALRMLVPRISHISMPVFDGHLSPGARERRKRTLRAGRLTAHAASGSATYGMATVDGYSPPSRFAYCSATVLVCGSGGTGTLLGYYSQNSLPPTTTQDAYAGIRSTSGADIKYERISVPYDALYTYTSSGCTFSPALLSGPGLQDYENLVWNVQAAEADGLTPEVVFTTGTGAAGYDGELADPIVPDPGWGSGATNPTEGFTTAGLDYYCGTYGIMLGLRNGWTGGDYPDQVTRFEAFNEPDGLTQEAAPSWGGGYDGQLGPYIPAMGQQYPDGPCGSEYYGASSQINDCGGETNAELGNETYLCGNSSYANCGAIEASELWLLAEDAYQVGIGASNDYQIAALTVSRAQDAAYVQSYALAMLDSYICVTGYVCNTGLSYPTVWAVHDYDDPSSGRLDVGGDISSFVSNLSGYWSGGQQVWITEAGNDLRAPATSDANGGNVCGTGGTFGSCINANPSAQANGAATFRQLYEYGGDEDITQTDWFELQPANPSTGYDSALMSAAEESGGFSAPPGSSGYSALRESLCVFDGLATSYCSSNPLDAENWSVDPP
jgi:hypothetical protein